MYITLKCPHCGSLVGRHLDRDNDVSQCLYCPAILLTQLHLAESRPYTLEEFQEAYAKDDFSWYEFAHDNA